MPKISYLLWRFQNSRTSFHHVLASSQTTTCPKSQLSKHALVQFEQHVPVFWSLRCSGLRSVCYYHTALFLLTHVQADFVTSLPPQQFTSISAGCLSQYKLAAVSMLDQVKDQLDQVQQFEVVKLAVWCHFCCIWPQTTRLRLAGNVLHFHSWSSSSRALSAPTCRWMRSFRVKSMRYDLTCLEYIFWVKSLTFCLYLGHFGVEIDSDQDFAIRERQQRCSQLRCTFPCGDFSTSTWRLFEYDRPFVLSNKCHSHGV